MDNAYQGHVELKLDGEVYRLAFTWSVLAQLRTKYGQKFDTVILQATQDFDLDVMANIVSIASGEALTPERVKELSPPILECINAINTGLNYAFYGVGSPEKQDDDGVKKNKFVTLLSKLLMRR